jgi:predicted DNA-binding transcriptional regulator AlpA
MSDHSRTLSASEAAKFVGLSESTLAKLRLYGNGPQYCKLGRRVVYRAGDLETWLQSRIVHDTTEAEFKFAKAAKSIG